MVNDKGPNGSRRGGKNTQKNYTKKGLNDLDNRDGVVTHLKPDILEGEVKWTLGSITTKKASGGDGIPAELFQILKDDVIKCCTQYASQFRKLSNGHRARKGLFSFQCKEGQCQRVFRLPYSCANFTN